MYICIYVSMYLCIYVSMYLCIYVYMYYVYMYICIYLYMYICIYVYMYICPTHHNVHIMGLIHIFNKFINYNSILSLTCHFLVKNYYLLT